MSHGPWFAEMVRNEAQDEQYRADVKAERESFVRQICTNPSCYGGDVVVPDPSGLRVVAVCSECAGKGWILTEREK